MKKVLLSSIFAFISLLVFSQNITVTTPNGGEQWEPGTIETITWNSTAASGFVQIKYSSDGGSNYNFISFGETDDGSYDWSIPSNINSTNCLIQILDAGNTADNDVSDAVFTIATPKTISVTNPNGGESLTAGNNENITWNYTGAITYVELYYSTDGGSNYVFIDDGIAASTQSYTWTLPNVSSSNCLVAVKDLSGSGAADTSDVVFSINPAIDNYALDFDGVDDYVSIPNQSYQTNDPMTIEFWMNTTQISQGGLIGNITATGASGSYILFLSGGGIAFRYNSSSTWINASNGAFVSSSVNDGSWHHIALVVDGNNMAFYIDGVLDRSATNLLTFDATTNNLILGEIPWTGENFDGMLDEVRIWNATRSTAEISGYMNACLTGSETGLVAYYDFEDGTNSSILSDLTLNGNDGTLTNMDIATDWVTSAHLCETPNPLVITQPNGGETYNASSTDTVWFSYTGTQTYFDLYHSVDNGSSWVFNNDGINSDDGYGIFYVPSTTTTQALVRLTNGIDADTSDAVFNIDPALPTISITAPNGGETLTQSSSYNITWDYTGNINTVELKYSTDGGSTYTFINDFIAASTQSYTWTVPNVTTTNALIVINEEGGSNATDTSDAVFSIGAGISNYALNFDGSNDYVNIPDDAAFEFNGGDFTIEFWNYQGSAANGEIISKRGSSSADGLLIGAYNNNYTLWLTSSGGWDVFNGTAFASIDYGVWTHIAFVREGSDYKMYKNGVLQNTYSGGGLVNNGHPITFGKNLVGVGSYSGDLDEVRIWNTARSEAEINAYMNECFNSSMAGLVASYDFEDGTGSSTLTDVTGNGHTGTLTNMDAATDWVAQGYTCETTPTLVITQPNGGETLTQGSSYNITWDYAGGINTVELKYSTDGGSTYTFINDFIAASTQSYTWTVPNVTTTNALIVINEEGGSNATDTSDAVFTIGSGGSSNYSLDFDGTSEYISIADDPVFDIDDSFTIEAWIKTTTGGQQGVVTQGLDAGNGYAFFVVGSTVYFQYYSGGGYNNSGTALGVSGGVADGNWHHIAVTKNGSTGRIYVDGIMLQENTAMNSVDESTSNIHIGYHQSVGQFVGGLDEVRFWNYARSEEDINNYMNTCISSGESGLSAAYNFDQGTGTTATDVTGGGNDGTLTNMDGATDWVAQGYTCGTPDNYITVISPNGGETLTGGSSYSITWAQSGLSDINIEYSTNNGGSWTSITTEYPVSGGTYSWSVPSVSTTEALVRVYDHWGSGVGDTSDVVFTIGSSSSFSVSVTSPNGGESLTGGNTHTISWTNTGSVDYVDLYYSTDGGSSWIFINDGLNPNSAYNWTVPNVSSSQCLIKAVANSGASQEEDISDGNFSINATSNSLTLTYPNGMESFTGGSVQTISWTSTGSISNVELWLSTDGGSTWSYIDDYAQNTGTYNWTVPNITSSNCFIKINEVGNTAVVDVSDDNFSINSSASNSLTLTYPNGMESFTAGTVQEITWNSTGSISHVELWLTTNGGVSWNYIDDYVQNTGSYNWTVPNVTSSNCFIMINEVGNGTVYDMTDDNFSINSTASSSLTLYDPTGGEVLTQGQTFYIEWGYSNVSWVNLYYSIDNGSTWNTIALSYSASATNYPWTVPNVNSTECLVKITDPDGNAPEDVSTSTFTIQEAVPSLTLTTPNGGETWNAGSNYYIYWNSTNVDYVKLEYSLDGGSSWSTVVSSTNASTGYYLWAVPSIVTSNAMVRVSDASDAGLFDTSNSVFSIINPSITITTPNGGESYTGLDYQPIYWNSTGLSNYVRIEYSLDNGSTWSTVASYTYNDGVHYWYVPNTASTTCLMRVKDYYNNSISDVSDATFTINTAPATVVLTSPNGAESWGVGTGRYIQWNKSNVTSVSIDYSTDGGSTWQSVATGITSSYYYWTVPNTPSSNCYVRVTDESDGSVTDMSDDNFSIVEPSYVVTNPNGGESLDAGTYHNITWTSEGVSSYVKIEYSTDNGSTWNIIAYSSYNDGSHNWYVPDVSSSSCLIKVSDYYDNSYNDISNAVFTINPLPPSITVTYPNGGQTFAQAGNVNLYWNSTHVDSVDIELSTDGGNTWTLIANDIENNNYYSWTVPTVTSSACYIKITDISDGSVADVSNYAFTIAAPYIDITAPDGGETYEEGQSTYIRWNSIGVSAVDIEYSSDNGINWTEIATNRYNYNYYYWNVPTGISNDYLVRVTDHNDTTMFDESEATFSVIAPVPVLTLYDPNGGEYFYTNYSYYIRWYSKAVDNIKLEYSLDNGGLWNLIHASYPASGGYYYWTTPQTTSTECLVRISDADDSSLSDESVSTFTIAEPVPSITLNSPNGGETWYEGSYRYISWQRNFVNQVNVELSTDNGSSWSTLASNLNANYYYWYVPNTPSTTCLVKVTDASDQSVTDQSAATFTIATPVVNTNTLVVNSIVPEVFCKEDTIRVYFTATGTYNTGNTFTAQLSDSTGNFSYPLAIGDFDGTASDTIKAVVPASVLNGSGYRIRVVASDWTTTGTDNGTDILISSPEFDFVADDVIKYLPNGQVNFTYLGDTANMVSYDWSFGDQNTSTSINPLHNYSDIGYFDVGLTVTDVNDCSIAIEKQRYMRVERLFANTSMETNSSAAVTGIHFDDIERGFMTLEDGSILLSSDSGATWTPSPSSMSSPLTNTGVVDSLWFVSGEDGMIMMSNNKGQTWNQYITGTAEKFNSLSFLSGNKGYAVGSNGVVYEYDGSAWTPNTSGVSSNLNSIKVVDSVAFAVGDNGKIIKNDGSGWSPLSSPVSDNILEIYGVTKNQLYAVTENGKVIKWDGTSWSVTLSGVDVDFTSVSGLGTDSAWAVADKGIIYRSLDGGDSWERYSVGAEVNLKRVFYLDGKRGNNRAASPNRGYTAGENGDARWFDNGEGRGGGSSDTTGTGSSVNEVSMARLEMNVFPNPTTDVFSITTFVQERENMNITLKDVQGQLVGIIINQPVEGEVRITYDVSNLTDGIYFIHVSQGNKQWIQKLMLVK